MKITEEKAMERRLCKSFLKYGFNHFDKETAELNVYDWNTEL